MSRALLQVKVTCISSAKFKLLFALPTSVAMMPTTIAKPMALLKIADTMARIVIVTMTIARVGRLYVSADISGTQTKSKLRRKTSGTAE